MSFDRNNLVICYTTHVESFKDLDEYETGERINHAVQLFAKDVITITLNEKIIYAKAK